MSPNNNSFFGDLTISYGENIKTTNDVILVLNNRHQISEIFLKQIGLNNITKYEEVINYEFKIGNSKYIIKGVSILSNESVYQEGLYFVNNNFKDYVPMEIFLYPINYQHKQNIISYLDSIKEISYTDYADSTTELSKSLMNGLSTILICFSMFSLIVCTIMIGILSYISIIERTKYIGILKVNGVSNKEILLIFILESIFITGMAGVYATSIVDLLSILINKIIYNITGLENVVILSEINSIRIIIMCIILGIIGSYLPLRRIKKINVAEVLKGE